MAPTYLAIGALGLNCGIINLTTIAAANMICSEMGLDPIAAGGTVATAMELVEKGVAAMDDLKRVGSRMPADPEQVLAVVGG